MQFEFGKFAARRVICKKADCSDHEAGILTAELLEEE
jgi:hypothetical protein